MTHYIALGGIGCRTLNAYSDRNPQISDRCYYIDTDPATAADLNPCQKIHLIRHLPQGTAAYTQIGKNAVRFEIMTNRLSAFFAPILQDPFAEPVIVTSSFGGFGSAAAIEFADYLQALLWEQARMNHPCKVIALSERYGRSFGLPKVLLDKFSFNTFDMVAEFHGRSTPPDSVRLVSQGCPVFNPGYTFFLIDTEQMSPEDFWTVLDQSDTQLLQLDIGKQYADLLKPQAPTKKVFISYSFRDQAVADMLADALIARNMDAWIATRSIHEGSYAAQIIQGIKNADIFVVLLSKYSIASEQVKNEIDRAFARLKEGLKLIPFILDDTQLDDECAYYLCRQEFFNGRTPPIQERIQALVEQISSID